MLYLTRKEAKLIGCSDQNHISKANFGLFQKFYNIETLLRGDYIDLAMSQQTYNVGFDTYTTEISSWDGGAYRTTHTSETNGKAIMHTTVEDKLEVIIYNTLNSGLFWEPFSERQARMHYIRKFKDVINYEFKYEGNSEFHPIGELISPGAIPVLSGCNGDNNIKGCYHLIQTITYVKTNE